MSGKSYSLMRPRMTKLFVCVACGLRVRVSVPVEDCDGFNVPLPRWWQCIDGRHFCGTAECRTRHARPGEIVQGVERIDVSEAIREWAIAKREIAQHGASDARIARRNKAEDALFALFDQMDPPDGDLRGP